MAHYSLVSIRAFREVVRSGSFTVASLRLGVTQSAVSKRVHTLEKQLGVKLLRFFGRHFELTAEGEKLFWAVDKSFDMLEDAVGRIRSGKIKKRLVLGVLSSFATKWLLPRLGCFYRQYADVELIVRSGNHTVDIEREPVDLAVVNLPSPPASPHVKSVRLWNERIFAVCSPSYLYSSDKPLRFITDLSAHVLLHDETEVASERKFDWQTWLSHFGEERVLEKASCQFFSQSDLVLQAAIAGHGVALTRTSLAVTDVHNGLLVNPFDDTQMQTQSACYLCGLEEVWSDRTVATLRDWIVAQSISQSSLPLAL